MGSWLLWTKTAREFKVTTEGIGFGVRTPVISGYDPEIYEHRATMVLENEIW